MIQPCYGTEDLKKIFNCGDTTLCKIFNEGGLKRTPLYKGCRKYVVSNKTLNDWLIENEVSVVPDFDP